MDAKLKLEHEEEKSHCIYYHLSPSGKYYIGQAVNAQYRWNNGNGYKQSPYLWNAIQKYGWENFKHEILFENLTKWQADVIETYLIDKFNLRNPNIGYNIKGGGAAPEHSNETKLKMKDAKRNVMKRVFQYSLDGQFISEYESVSEASRITGVYSGVISSCCLNNGKTAGGYQWSYKQKKSLQPVSIISALKDENPVYQYTLNGLLIDKYSSTMEAERKTGISQANISACCVNKRNHAGGYIWSHEPIVEFNEIKNFHTQNNSGVNVFTSNHEFIAYYATKREAAKALGVDSSAISKVCNGIYKSTKGYYFEHAS